MSGKIDAKAFNERTRSMPRSLFEGPVILSKNSEGEMVEQRIDPEWTSYMNRRSYIAPKLKAGPFSYDIDESGEPIPAPLFPDTHHPLSYCYRLRFDQSDWEPRVYCVGIPCDDDIVIFSGVLPDKTWAELKRESSDLRNLNRQFPLINYRLRLREMRDPEKVFQEFNEAKRKAENEEEVKTMLTEDPLFSEPVLKKLKEKSPSFKNTRAAKQLPTLPIKNTRTPKAHEYKQNKPPVAKKKKAKKDNREYTPEERIYFEIHGCSYEQYIERKQRDIRKKLGVTDH